MEEEIVIIGHRRLPHHGVFICDHVFEGQEVRLACFENDGDLQFLCGGSEGHDSCKIAGLNHLLEHHPEIAHVPPPDRGQYAERDESTDRWTVGILDQDD